MGRRDCKVCVMPIQIRQHDNADQLPPTNGGDPSPYELPRQRPRLDWPSEIARWVGGIVLLLVVYWLVGGDVREWLGTWEGGAVRWLVIFVALVYAARRMILVRQPGGYLVALWQATRIDAERVVMARLDVERTHAGTAGRQLAQQTYSPTITSTPQLSAGDAVDGGLVEDVPPEAINADTWLPWLDALPHLLVAGRTGDGKTTLGNALLGRCINAGDEIAVIDPKWQPGKWRGCAPLAGSLDYDQLYDALEAIGAELDARYQEFNQGRPGETFPRLRVVIDEVPTIILGAIVGGKIINKRRFQQWLMFATKLGSIAREVNVHVWLFSQSPLIKDLYFSSSMRDNFNRIALASQVRDLLSEESNKATKEALINLTRGKAFTAAMEYRSTYYVLDTSSVPQIAQERVTQPHVWTPTNARQFAPQSAARPVVSASVRPSETMRASFTPADLLSTPVGADGRTDGPADEGKTRLYLKAMAAAGKTREYARARMTILNMPFENKLWTEVRRELGLRD